MNEVDVDGVLDKWMVSYYGGPVSAQIYGDTKGRWTDGHLITTSTVVEWIPDDLNPTHVRTRNSYYKLGDRL